MVVESSLLAAPVPPMVMVPTVVYISILASLVHGPQLPASHSTETDIDPKYSAATAAAFVISFASRVTGVP